MSYRSCSLWLCYTVVLVLVLQTDKDLPLPYQAYDTVPLLVSDCYHHVVWGLRLFGGWFRFANDTMWAVTHNDTNKRHVVMS